MAETKRNKRAKNKALCKQKKKASRKSCKVKKASRYLSDVSTNTSILVPITTEFQEVIEQLGNISMIYLTNSQSDSTTNADLAHKLENEPGNENNIIFIRRNAQSVRSPKDLDKPKTRKRFLNPDLWIDIKAKKARAKGVVGIGRKNSTIKERVMRDGCGGKCSKKCQSKINEEDRKNAFKLFWDIPEHRLKWQCILNWTSTSNSDSESLFDSETESESEISETEFNSDIRIENNELVYKLPKIDYAINHNMIKVCRKMFLDTLGISYQFIKTALKKRDEVNGTGLVENDLRGKHRNRPLAYPEAIRNLVIAHIRRFPVVESHFVRADTSRQYLPEGLNLSKMRRMLIDELQRNAIRNVEISRQAYAKIFNENFNLGFFIPKKDRCELCERHKNSNATEKEAMKGVYKEHQRNVKIARKLVKKSKTAAENSSTYVFHFDLQKILTTPRAQVSNMYYMSRLIIFNLTIYDLHSHDGLCNLWNETVALRGSNEVASILMDHINKKLVSNPEIKEIHSYSDNCGGQNKNQNIFSMFYLTANMRGVKIIHRFLEVGHTQSAGDSMHACIENHVKHLEVFIQEQWGDMMKDVDE